MLSERIQLAFKTLLGLLPLFYGGIVIATLPNTLLWVLVIGVVLITLLVLVGWLDLPLQTIWPIFPAAILILTGTLALLIGVPAHGPLTRLSGELLALYLIAALYILWGARATWKATHAW